MVEEVTGEGAFNFLPAGGFLWREDFKEFAQFQQIRLGVGSEGVAFVPVVVGGEGLDLGIVHERDQDEDDDLISDEHGYWVTRLRSDQNRTTNLLPTQGNIPNGDGGMRFATGPLCKEIRLRGGRFSIFAAVFLERTISEIISLQSAFEEVPRPARRVLTRN